ncbi:AfsR/SARP family transcriptional regulator [Kitasatospora viridis]|uniref:DNA-binding SARP family transcriptional activator n=1 Tax=Kitasatospora viridis TaxID=281105 RepID=A0A561UBR3_9ACTN|nr:AfsR/SARP family transcriptional regulator [Kitasatospora viridis]TWF96800.1 DNA-binding SARP family transcriptional activator [Kitasatospora viridis]
MEFGILGPLLVKDTAGARAVPAPKQRILLAALLIRPGQPVTADRLADLLWDGRPPRSADSTLRNYVMRLRQVLGPAGERIETAGGGYLLRAAPAEVDLHRFTELRDRGLAALRADAVPHAATLLREALALWRGPALVDVPSDALHREEADWLSATRLDALELRMAAELRLGRHADALAELRELTTAHPERERFWVQLTAALERDGRPREALAAHRAARAALRRGLAVEPGAELRSARRRLLASSGFVSAHQLPPGAPDFTGRSAELRRLTERLAGAGAAHGAPQVLVLTGGPGVGKSALALRAAQLVREVFADGTLYAELDGGLGGDGPGGGGEPTGRVLRTLLGALGVPAAAIPAGTAARTALYRSVLADRQVLLVLDGARDTGQVLPLLPTGPGSATLVTSRDRLADLPGARPLLLEPLSPEEARQLLVRLLGARRLAAEPGAAAELLAACDGLPLALRICAARLGTRPAWSLAHLAGRLAAPDRVLEELRVGSLDVRRAYAESFGRLDPEAAAAFRRLGTPRSPAPTPGEEVLERLVDAHLVVSPVPGRYALPRLSHAFARWLGPPEAKR